MNFFKVFFLRFLNFLTVSFLKNSFHVFAKNLCTLPKFAQTYTPKLHTFANFHVIFARFAKRVWPNLYMPLPREYKRKSRETINCTVKRPKSKSSLMRQIAPLEYINTLLKRSIPTCLSSKSSKLAFYFDKKFNNERHCTLQYVQVRKMHGGFSISKSVFLFQ